MRTGRISKEDVWLAFHSTLWKTLIYPLPALNLSIEDCDKIMAPVLVYLLPAQRICRNFPRALVYSSIKYMGIGIKHLYMTQEILRIKDILTHTYHSSTTGLLYRSTFELFFLELGMGTDISAIPEDVIQALTTDTLCKSTSLFLSHHKLELCHDIVIKPLRENDQPIMLTFLHLRPDTSELIALNCCCLYLQVYWLSEICTGDGITVTEDAWRGKRFDLTHKLLHWPRQNKPSKSDWIIWQVFIKKAFIVRGLRLKHTLGNWLHLEDTWEWYFSPGMPFSIYRWRMVLLLPST
jgi:hypothetical protein